MKVEKDNVEPAPTQQDFPIVGLGASAGGLEAFKEFLGALTLDSGMAYVLVQHLDPTHESVLPEILSRYTKLPVMEITDDIHLAPNNVYVIPENKILTSIDGVLKLEPRENKKSAPTVDIFFSSLAAVHLNLSVGIILSGMGTDGAVGLKSIKEHGGITFAQDHTAAYNEMPQNAIKAQIVDFILSPSEIPAKLLEVMFCSDKGILKRNFQTEEEVYHEIIVLLKNFSGVDFTYYKQTTIRRRIARRMAMSKTKNLEAYLKFLKGDQAAPEALFNDLLIQVTTFFRDPKLITGLKNIVFPELVSTQSHSKSIRIWVAGCSTGEEAYSIAILLNEFLGENSHGFEIQIFASDISELSIAKARIGFYSKTQVVNVSDVLLKKYFTKKNTGYQINRQIRDKCVFAVHNFLKDPPFAKMNIITCQNVLIYMNTFLQKKALTTFHYALEEEGFLLLGKSETIAPAIDFFAPLEKSGKIYTKKVVTGRLMHQVMRIKEEELKTKTNIQVSRQEILKTDFIKSAEKMLLTNYTPASVIINEHLDVVHINGNVSPFIEIPQGKPTFNILKIVRQGLSFELRNAIHKAKDSNNKTSKEGIQVPLNGINTEVTIEVQPMIDTMETYFLVVFYNTPFQKTQVNLKGLTLQEINADVNLKRIHTLEKELAQTHANVSAIAEAQETSNEELQSTNEELLSSSEELQSLNEELETSKEELQSSNEELIIINSELLNKQDQINASRNYTEAIVATLREPIVVLDTKLRIKNINRAFSKKYNITKEEAKGKLIYEIQNHLFDNAPMRSMLEKILPEKMQLDDYQIAVNLQPYGESIMLLNAKQVTNEKSKEQLILLAIEDITERKIIEERLQSLSDGFENKVKERTAELLTSNSELENSVKDLHQANIKLQQFAYIASHDLQEPLRKILMFISILQSNIDDLPPNAVGILTKISNSSNRMKTLITDLLAYSYLSNDDALFVTTDLNSVLKNILTDFELLIHQKKVKIESAILPVIKGIPLQMNQLFYNIISNALKFSVNENAFIHITSKKLTAQQVKSYPFLKQEFSYYEIIFADNGIGFEQQYERQIFTIFRRLHSNEAYVGTGIGLAISHKIVENHNGYIFAKSELNKGAAFHIILPII